ncbi:hypothetical protein GCM10010423_41970 [Streptomyces levis]|uniref:Secreted protein n=1 Tax=Streptomyces levis TaxID=285566 RepID=A0ABN3NVH4_9ACTN
MVPYPWLTSLVSVTQPAAVDAVVPGAAAAEAAGAAATDMPPRRTAESKAEASFFTGCLSPDVTGSPQNLATGVIAEVSEPDAVTSRASPQNSLCA